MTYSLLPEPAPSVDAVLFDMDGTLVFNMHVHAQAWVETLESIGVPGLTPAYFERELAGLKNEELIALVLGRPVDADEVMRIAERKESLYRERFLSHLVPAPGLFVLLDRLERARIPSAVATAAPEQNRAFILDGLDLRRRFAAVVGAEQVQRGKPAPDIFLAAAAALHVHPSRCVVFEDAPLGVRAAVASGARCIGIPSAVPAAMLLGEGAIATTERFDPLSPAAERVLFGSNP